MDNSNYKGPLPLSALGNYTKHAVESFEDNIVHQHNHLEKVKKYLANKK